MSDTAVLNGTQLECDGEELRPDGSCPKCERINQRIQAAITTHANQRYREGLQRAAKEVCDGCENEEEHGPAHKIQGSTRWWHGEESPLPCEAGGIHALLRSAP